ncbi:formate dehydrogenase subunit gamma [Rhizobium sp. 9T]|jgi:formate dehydrogenase subunit gamma|uniref:Formate dehydrogenase subunit gamma n=1 Tax=Rhizobium croatiense TaxID=2867516 RepID=A0ABS7M564_9HYPH|nr:MULTISPECIES: formate dehydrogenase subunit gamma [Rhizobium]MBY4608951.1 formate dehydrogenase subunit gamma [Rhizobium croatiense]MBY4632241.1 formate dehydrogenase subunit gamma [Rhizobium croatiense]PDT13212.1 formate dehydrogenase subunit gamma [Rhizobium sp. M1]PDT36981.1 formate dehydrogenase subunit gamma [Rhizobium sp. M10]PDV88062.1 formate dehydrogenase subunit gamma [Rhizobium sp. H4]
MTIHIAEGDIAARTRSIVADLRFLEGPLLPILHQVQQEFGYVPQQALPVIAEELNLSRAEVHGVMSFYHDYRDHPAGRHVLKLCRAEACQSMGGDALAERIKALLGIDFHQTTLDGSVTLEAVYCLGLCACGPSAMLDGEVYGRVDDQMATELVAEARR